MNFQASRKKRHAAALRLSRNGDGGNRLAAGEFLPPCAFPGLCGARSRQVRVTGGAAGTSPESAKEVDNTSGAQTENLIPGILLAAAGDVHRMVSPESHGIG